VLEGMPSYAEPPPFEIVPPRGAESALVVEVPHAGLWLDAEAMAYTICGLRNVARDADLYVDSLVRPALRHGAHLLVARTSRYLCDLNRGPEDVDGRAVIGAKGRESPHGLVWHRTTTGEPVLAGPLPAHELDRRVSRYYHPYHSALATLLQRKLDTFGFVILVAAHSMPSTGRDLQGNETQRADIVPGTRGRSSAANAVIDLVEMTAGAHELSVRHDNPYRGGFTTMQYGRPRRNVHAIQIEAARRLYMDEATLAQSPEGTARTAAYYDDLCSRLAQLKPSQLV
jgi:N-formylglutamate deformylase